MAGKVEQGDSIAGLSAAWVGLLRAGCVTLSKADAAVATSVSVNLGLPRRPQEALALAKISRRLAEEYGLQAKAVFGEATVTICLRRCNEAGEGCTATAMTTPADRTDQGTR